MVTPLDSKAAVSAQAPSQVTYSERLATRSGLPKGKRAHWSGESDYQFVLVLAQHTVCNERQGLLLNHKYIDQMVVKDIAAGLENNTPLDTLVEELAQKYPSKKEEHRSYECINLMLELRRKLPEYCCDQLNHKHMNMWTRTFAPFRQLFDSGQLFRGKQMMHKDNKRFAKAIFDFFVHIVANGMGQADPNMYKKGEDKGGKLLEQWLTAMLNHHGQNMVKFLFACGVKLAMSYIDTKRVDERTAEDRWFLKATARTPDQVLTVLKELMNYIARNEAYSALTDHKGGLSTSVTNDKEGAPLLADDRSAIRVPIPQQAAYQRPPAACPPAHNPYGAHGPGPGAYPGGDYRMLPSGMPPNAMPPSVMPPTGMPPSGMPRYHHQPPPPWGPADPYGYRAGGYYDYPPYESPYGLPPGGRFVYIPPEGHPHMRPGMDPREAYRMHPAMHAPPQHHPDPSGYASMRPPGYPPHAGIPPHHPMAPARYGPQGPPHPHMPYQGRYHPYGPAGSAWQMRGPPGAAAWAQRGREQAVRHQQQQQQQRQQQEMHSRENSMASPLGYQPKQLVDSPRKLVSGQSPVQQLAALPAEKQTAAVPQFVDATAQLSQSTDLTRPPAATTSVTQSPAAEPARTTSSSSNSVASAALTALVRAISEQS
ncbi:hypothetical protein H4R19_000566 [Coemansia spiralis]|nr:hypothetical protein H4R19_000566 [Coemansia spiralis]